MSASALLQPAKTEAMDTAATVEIRVPSVRRPRAQVASQQQPQQLPTNTGLPMQQLKECMDVAVLNKQKIRAFFLNYLFENLQTVETGQYAAVLYFICDQSGAILSVPTKRPRNLQPSLIYVRVTLFGTYEMFTAPGAPRNFFFDFEPAKKGCWQRMQGHAILSTQRLLNSDALWFAVGRSRCLTAETASFDADAIAMENLRRLGTAGIPQPAATLFVDIMGRIKHILFARPDSSSIKFIDAEVDSHFTVLRICMSESAGVTLDSPFQVLNQHQQMVVSTMKNILDSFGMHQ